MTTKKTAHSKKVVYQEHHPNKEKFPDWTIRLRRNHHLFIWRQVQALKDTRESLLDLIHLREAISYEIERREALLNE